MNVFLGYIFAGIYSHDTNMPNCAPLWFLTCIFVAYIYFYFLVICDFRKKVNYVIVAYILIFVFIHYVMMLYDVNQLPWHIEVSIVGSLFMYLGYKMKNYTIKNKFLLFIMVILASIIIIMNDRVNMVTNSYGCFPMFFVAASITCISFEKICKMYYDKIPNALKIIVSYMGANSIFFIGFNYMVNIVLRNLFKYIDVSRNIYTVVDTIIVVVVCCTIAFLFSKIKLYIKGLVI